MRPADKAKMIFNYINQAPGIRYRELLRLTGFSHGVLSNHLKNLENKNRVKVKRLSSTMTRHYPVRIKVKESDILDYLLPTTKRKIIFYLLKHDKCTYKEIVHHVKKAPATTSSHLKDLKNAGIIFVFKGNNNNKRYQLKNKMMIAKVLSKYKKRL
jgi:predicted transcriptional regulator